MCNNTIILLFKLRKNKIIFHLYWTFHDLFVFQKTFLVLLQSAILYTYRRAYTHTHTNYNKQSHTHFDLRYWRISCSPLLSVTIALLDSLLSYPFRRSLDKDLLLFMDVFKFYNLSFIYYRLYYGEQKCCSIYVVIFVNG